MKKKIVALLGVCVLAAASLTACGKADEAVPVVEENAPVEETAEEVADTTEEEEEESVGMANPWVDITEEEANELCLRLFKAPEGATVQGWMKCEELGDPDKGIGPMIQLSFALDDMNFTARAQQGAAEDTDIAGNYVEWTVGPEDCTLANWGGGNMAGKMYRSINDTGYVDMITWYDVEIGISYSLSVAAKDLDGFDIQAVAEQMFNGENEFEDMPADFLQEQSGITQFGSYDDVIAQLKSGQGYAYIKVIGSDEEILAVTDLVFEYDHSACEASLYGKPEGEVKQLGLVTGNGSANPLRLENGIIYAGTNHTYETYFLSEDGYVMYKDSIDDGVNSGTNEFSGFTRDKNTFDTNDYTGGQEEFDKLMAERENKPIIEFTVIE